MDTLDSAQIISGGMSKSIRCNLNHVSKVDYQLIKTSSYLGKRENNRTRR
jgi:hypothetical protein